MKWEEGKCTMMKDGSQLPVFMDQGCPSINPREGQYLMEEVEELYLRQSKMRRLATVPGKEFTEDEKSLKHFMELFPKASSGLQRRWLVSPTTMPAKSR